MVLKIKELLYDRGFTIAGARKQLSAKAAPNAEPERDQGSAPGPQGTAGHLDFASNGKRKVDVIGT